MNKRNASPRLSQLPAKGKQAANEIYFYIVLSRGDNQELLMVREVEKWSLPFLVVTPNNHKLTHNLNKSLFEKYGIVTTLLQTLIVETEPGTNKTIIICTVENHSRHWPLPSRGCWISCNELDSLNLVLPSHRQAIVTWMDRLAKNDNTNTYAPWQFPGWFDKTLAWINTQLVEIGVHTTGDFKQFAATEVHYLLEVSTDKGNFYLKAVRGSLAHEQPLTWLLSQIRPSYFPEVVVADNKQHYWIMRDVGGKRLDETGNLDRWEETLRALAQLQVDCAEHIDRLQATGCPNWMIEVISESIEPFMTVTFPQLGAGISEFPAILKQFNIGDLAQRLKEVCKQLADYQFPNSVGHGDFNFGNVLVTDDRICFIDWAEGYVGHPLFTAFDAINYLGSKRPDLKGVRTKWRKAYFEPWEPHFNIDHLTRAYCLARPLALFRSILRGSQYLLSLRMSQEERDRGINHLLRQFSLMQQAAYSPRIG
jgi:hypothetical protein